MKKLIRLVSWNVNGIRAAIKKGFVASLFGLEADIIALQETKIQPDQITDEIRTIDGYDSYWACSRVKKGYSGVAIFSRTKPLYVKTDFGISIFDDEGRVIEMGFNDFIFFNVYFPNGQMSEDRLQYKLDFYAAFFAYASALKSTGKKIVVAGDYNTAHNEIDLKHPKANENNSGFLRVERDWLDRITADGYVDTFRSLYPETIKYSWWTYRANARKNNAGWRIDYFFVSEDMFKAGVVKDAFIDNDVHGSDHCPVGIELELDQL